MPDTRIGCLYLPQGLPTAQAGATGRSPLLRLAWSFSPLVESRGDGEVLLSLSGLERRHPSEEHFAERLLQAAEGCGFCARLGIGSSPLVARMAARITDRLRVIAAGEEQAFLQPLPLEVLQMDGRLREKLGRLGIRKLGQLAALAPAQLRLRLGEDGLRLWREARGQDDRPLESSRPPEIFREEESLEYPLEQLEPLLLVMRELTGRLSQRLRERGWWAAELSLRLGLEPAGVFERAVVPASALPHPEVWMAVLRPLLEGHPPPAPVISVALQVEVCRPRPEQAELFEPTRPPPRRFQEALGQLEELAGAGRLGSPLPVDSHLPGDFRLRPFDWRSRAGPPAPPDLRPGLWRALRPPRAVRVELRDGRIMHLEPLRDDGDLPPGGPVARFSGPWRVEGEWWNEGGFARDCYQVELTCGVLWRLFFDRRQGCWFADGVLGTGR